MRGMGGLGTQEPWGSSEALLYLAQKGGTIEGKRRPGCLFFRVWQKREGWQIVLGERLEEAATKEGNVRPR